MKKNLSYSIMVLLLFAFTFTSCKKSTSDDNMSAQNDVQTLAKKFTEPINSDFANVMQQYHELNETDLKAFWTFVNRINHNPNSISAKDENTYNNNFSQLNEKSNNLFKKSLNKLNEAELFKIVGYERAKSNSSNENNLKPILPPNPTPCQYYSYPFDFYNAIYNPITISASAIVQEEKTYSYPSAPCDALGYIYEGTNWNAMYALTPLGSYQLGLQGGWGWDVRRENGKTIVWAPQNFITNAFGTFEEFNDHIRICKQPLAITAE